MRIAGVCVPLSIVALVLTLAAPAPADLMTFGFDCITDTNPVNAAIGQDQLLVDVSNGGNLVTFTFRNVGSYDCSITDVYYDDGALKELVGLIDQDDGTGGHSGVDFSQFATPKDLPGGNNANPVFQTTKGFSADSDNPPEAWGVEPGEWLGVVYLLEAGGTVEQVQQQLTDGTLRIGLHVQSFPDGGSESFVNNPVSTPEPATLTLLTLGALTALRRRRR